jgi:hypothetical protein
MLEYFTPEANELEDNDHHRQVRDITARPPNTKDDWEFTREEIRKVTEGMNKKSPGEFGITAEIYKLTFKIFPKSITALHNSCLKKGVFPEGWKKQKSY